MFLTKISQTCLQKKRMHMSNFVIKTSSSRINKNHEARNYRSYHKYSNQNLLNLKKRKNSDAKNIKQRFLIFVWSQFHLKVLVVWVHGIFSGVHQLGIARGERCHVTNTVKHLFHSFIVFGSLFMERFSFSLAFHGFFTKIFRRNLIV